MHWYNYLTLVAASVATVGQLWDRRWLLAAAFACLAAYQVFGKWFPAVLPTGVSDVFEFAWLCLIMVDIMRRRRRKAPADAGAR